MFLPCRPCCGGGGGVPNECSCVSPPSGQALQLPEECGIDYIAVDFEFSFTECGDLPVTGTVTLNQESYWSGGGYFVDENECYYDVAIGIGCFSGEFRFTISIKRVLTQGFGNCCRSGIFLCDDAPVDAGEITPTFLLPTLINGESCCPGILDSWDWETTDNAIFPPTICPGATVKITGMTKVML